MLIITQHSIESMEPNSQRLDPTKQNPWIIPLSIIISGALVGGGIFLSSRETKTNTFTQNRQNVDTIDIAPINSEDHLIGNPNAPIVIAEFSDTECPFCKQFHNTMKRVMDEYGKTGKVAWVYRHYPIAELHPLAQKQAEGLECAAEIGGNTAFWNLTDAIYARGQGSPALGTTELTELAATFDIDSRKFSDCVTSGRMALRVQEDMTDGERAGARGTPYSVLITKRGEKVSINGAQPFDIVKSVIDAALAQDAVN